MKVFKQTDSLFEALFDKMADWLRKLNANPLGSARVVSNPIFVILLIGCILKSSASNCWENLVKTKFLQNDIQVVRCLGWLVSFQNITLSNTNYNVENSNYLILLGLKPGILCVLGARDNHYTSDSLQG